MQNLPQKTRTTIELASIVQSTKEDHGGIHPVLIVILPVLFTNHTGQIQYRNQL